MKEVKGDIKVTFWGVRGSIPTPGRDFVRYGGNTPCVEVRCGDTILVFDAGTGIREFSRSILKEFNEKPLDLHLFISHTHWDHIQGFPFLDVAYIKNNRVTLYGGHTVSDLEKLILGQMEREYFPVSLFELDGEIKFFTMSDNPFFINDIKIYFTHLLHPALSLGFRIEYKDKIFVYCADNELLDDPELADYNRRNIGNLIKNADMLIAECQYTEEEYTGKVGWGHSSIDQVVKISNDFGVKNLFAFHHDPLHTDRDIDNMIQTAKRIAKKPLKVYGAKERMSVII